MIKDEKTNQSLKMVFIHHVNPSKEKKEDSGKLIYFENYAEAALKAFERDDITFDINSLENK